MPLAGGAQDGLVEVLPVVLRHEAEGGEEGPAEGVEAGVAVVGVGAKALVARVVLGAHSRAGGVAAEEGVQLTGAVVKVPEVGGVDHLSRFLCRSFKYDM